MVTVRSQVLNALRPSIIGVVFLVSLLAGCRAGLNPPWPASAYEIQRATGLPGASRVRVAVNGVIGGDEETFKFISALEDALGKTGLSVAHDETEPYDFRFEVTYRERADDAYAGSILAEWRWNPTYELKNGWRARFNLVDGVSVVPNTPQADTDEADRLTREPEEGCRPGARLAAPAPSTEERNPYWHAARPKVGDVPPPRCNDVRQHVNPLPSVREPGTVCRLAQSIGERCDAGTLGAYATVLGSVREHQRFCGKCAAHEGTGRRASSVSSFSCDQVRVGC